MAPRPIFPRLPLFGAFAAVGLALTVAAAGAVTHAARPEQSGHVVTASDLRFEDRSDGAVVALAADGHTVEVFEGEQGFLRGVLRGFARTRHLGDISPALPFRLTRWSDGRLTLDDPADGRHVELLAFGPTNASVFAKLLEPAL
jgi:putative photosynthetic complex assembly protein